MSDLKISQLSDGGASQAADEYVVARSGNNFRIDGASVAAAATSVGTLTSLTVSGDLTVDTSTLKVDSTNNRVGIGTASPGVELDVVGDFVTNQGTAKYGGIRMMTGRTDAAARNWGVTTNYQNFGDWVLRVSSANNTNPFTTGATVLTADASGNFGLGVTPSAGRGVLQLSAGIGFPATQVTSSDANTLDDYEEGTWTPALTGGGGSAGTYALSSAAGAYTKIGRVVIATAYVEISNKGSWSGNVRCSLPIQVAGAAEKSCAVRVQEHTFTGYPVAEPGDVNVSYVRFNLTASGTGQTNWDWSALSANAGNFINFTIVYNA
jgi:hypothetical protein